MEESEEAEEGCVELRVKDVDSDGEDAWGTEIGELPHASALRSRWTKVDQAPGHVLLMIDTSGSMRTEDVAQHGKEGVMVTRLEAVCRCVSEFLRNHGRTRPQDRFSVVTFSEEATLASRHADATATAATLEGLSLRGARGTHYEPALRAAHAALVNETVCGPRHIVLLSDGRPADTKAALQYFQDEVLQASVQLHGIGFGSSVQTFAALQQLACLSGGIFTMASCSVQGLCDAFDAVSSSITSLSSRGGADGRRRIPRRVDFEIPENMGAFGKKGVLRFEAARSTFRYDGAEFRRQTWPAGMVERRLRPHMRGGMRLVYGFRDRQLAEEGTLLVAKSSRFLDRELNTSAVVESHVKSTAVARYYAAHFNKRLSSSGLASLFFVPCFKYERSESTSDTVSDSAELADEPGAFAAERFLPGVFMKYTSNNGYVNDGITGHMDVVQAFTHFTFASSGGELLVADLQGVARETEVLLTDPQVLSSDGRFGPGDLCGSGMHACLAVHCCGPACKALGLTPLTGKVLHRLCGKQRAPTEGWEMLSSRCNSKLSVSAHSDFEKVSEHHLTNLVGSAGTRSRQDSLSSWPCSSEIGARGPVA